MIKEVNSQELIGITAQLAHSIWNDYYVPIIGQQQVNYMLDTFQSVPAITKQLKEGYHYFLAYNDDQALGYTAVVRNDNRLMLSKLYVSEAARGMGLGTALLHQCKEVALGQGCTTIWLTVNRYNNSSISWYQNKGFQIVDEKKQDIGKGYVMDDYILEVSVDNLKI